MKKTNHAAAGRKKLKLKSKRVGNKNGDQKAAATFQPGATLNATSKEVPHDKG